MPLSLVNLSLPFPGDNCFFHTLHGTTLASTPADNVFQIVYRIRNVLYNLT